MRSLSAVAVALSVTSVLTACGEPGATSGARSGAGYDGPLHVARADATHRRAGAAGDVVECGTFGDGGFSDAAEYAEGATADSAEEALEVARSEWRFGGQQEGLVVAREEDDRVLYVVEVDGVAKQAVVVRDGPATEGAGGPGWYVESWAHCDYAELPRSFTDSIGLQIWTDAAGRPVPTRIVESWTGPEHCEWQSMTFLNLGKAEYVRDPLPGLGAFFDEAYEAHAELPAAAVDTGFQRDGDRLWLSPGRQRAFVGSEDDVEVWPRALEHLGCD